MDVEEMVEILLRNRNQKAFDTYHDNQEFSFDTVFSIYSYSYCCCPCSFEHEFFDYITDEGINETMFAGIKESIGRGKCEHVDGALSQYVHKTRVLSQHVVAASGILPLHHDAHDTSIFRLYPYMIAVFKKHRQVIEKYKRYWFEELYRDFDFCDALDFRLMFASRKKQKPDTIEIQSKQITDVCASEKDPLLFTILDTRCEILDGSGQWAANAFEDLYRNKSLDMLERMCNFIRSNAFRHNIDRCLQSIIVHDEAEMLADCISNAHACYDDKELGRIKSIVTETSRFLHREKCLEVSKTANLLSEAMDSDLGFIEQDSILNIATNTLLHFPDRLYTTIETIIRNNPTAVDLINCKLSEGYIKKKAVIKAVVDNGCDINGAESNNPIEGILSNIIHAFTYLNIREALEMLIYENADVDQNSGCVDMAIRLDERIVKQELFLGCRETYTHGVIHDIGFSGVYKLDGLEHSPYGHEGESFALNFAAPLLLECGYSANNQVLNEALEKNLHERELEYIRRYVSNPRTLKSSCCRFLRSNFKGRAIHKFVAVANVPK